MRARPPREITTAEAVRPSCSRSPTKGEAQQETSVCIVDDASKIVREVRVASEPEALLQVLTNTIYR